MIIGRSAFGYKDNPFKISPCINNFYRMEVKNAIFDEIKIDGTIDKIYNSTKDEWNYLTIFDAKFQNSLEAGDVDNAGVPIEKILFQKRRKDTEYSWTDVATFTYSNLQKIYSVVDYYISNCEPMEYAIVPITNTVSGRRNIVDFTPSFDGVFLTSKDFNIRLMLNMTLGDQDHVDSSTNYETIGENSQFPIISYSNLDYIKSTLKATVMSDISIDQNNWSVHDEKIYREKIVKFLKNHKPKLYRAYNGDYYMISVVGSSVKVNPLNEVEGEICNISFDWQQCGNTDSDSMINNGFV